MRKARIFVPVAIFAMLIGVWGGTQLAAFASRGGHANAVKAGIRPAHTTTVTAHGAPKKTYLEDALEADIPVSSFTSVGTPMNVLCPGTSGKCTLVLHADNQFCFGASADYFYQEVSIDGSALAISPYSGAFAGELCQTHGWTWIQSVTHGHHTVQFQAGASGSTTEISDYSHSVTVYKP